MSPGGAPAARVSWLRAWGPAILWAGLIYLLSTEAFSGAATERWLELLIRIVWPEATAAFVAAIHAATRKSAHVAEYFVFVLLIESGFRAGGDTPAARRVGWAFAIAVGYAATDELHQWFVRGRSAAVGDVFFDSAGAAFGAVVARATRRGEISVSAPPDTVPRRSPPCIPFPRP